ncbi:hypothetical protein SteCoe_38283 [Stentor coeruleus]|uniref:Protein kinase domain-containing protein n=1 Tax=Stentor coeruleus TaxID=5963 RepID=A0A1R2ALL4_9CILI|nr:hypothetical protein SteCoe_38283 [Stentor coeruleus]
MGAGCCKSDDAHPISRTHGHKIAPFQLDSNRDHQKELTELTLTENTFNNSQIIWQRGDLVGEGVYGKVYQAMNLNTGELLAVKSYKLNHDEEIAQKELISIKRELLILKFLDHPNIIKYFQVDYESNTNTIDILIEYVPSGSMLNLLQKYRVFSESVIRNYTKQLLDGLDYLHSNEVIHRDLKSANILITENSTLKLTDFGCSRRFDSNVSSQSKSFKGSPYWMSPEMVTNTGHSYPSDIWSLGCLVIEMASGRPPWSNYSKFSKDVLRLIAKPGNMPDMPRVSSSLMDFISRCLQRDPEKRATAKELLAHEFIIVTPPAKCYDSIRTSANNLSVNSSHNGKISDMKKEL